MSPQPSVIPDLTEPIKVYRHWSVHKATGLLYAPMHNGYQWTPGENLAHCDSHPRIKGGCLHPSCSCGFYGVYQHTHNYALKTHYGTSSGTIFGVMEAYGKVSLGTQGLRCQKAKIVAMNLPYVPRWSSNRILVDRLMTHYPNVRFYKTREHLLDKEGVEYPTSLLSNREVYQQFG